MKWLGVFAVLLSGILVSPAQAGLFDLFAPPEPGEEATAEPKPSPPAPVQRHAADCSGCATDKGCGGGWRGDCCQQTSSRCDHIWDGYCCDRAPSRCDHIWDGYCSQRRGAGYRPRYRGLRPQHGGGCDCGTGKTQPVDAPNGVETPTPAAEPQQNAPPASPLNAPI